MEKPKSMRSHLPWNTVNGSVGKGETWITCLNTREIVVSTVVDGYVLLIFLRVHLESHTFIADRCWRLSNVSPSLFLNLGRVVCNAE